MIQPTPATRLAHNKALAESFLAKHKITCTIPQVSRQVELRKLNSHNLRQFGYNPSIIRHDGKFLLAYRWHAQRTLGTDLQIAEVDETSGSILSDKKLEIPGNLSTEDPKFFSDGKTLWISYVEADLSHQPFTCTTAYGELVEEKDCWKVAHVYRPKFPNHQPMEKNWVPFFYNGTLHFIYSCQPEHVVVAVEGEKEIARHVSTAPFWPWGVIKGGASPLPYKDKWLRFFHATLDTEPPPWHRRYYVGAYLMEPTPPFNFVAISREPILRGSEEDSTTAAERNICHHRKPQVVFPGSALVDKDGWLLSLGINDCQCAIAHIKESDLKL